MGKTTRASLAALELPTASAKRPRGRPPQLVTEKRQATTLRLPVGYLHKLRVSAVLRHTTAMQIIQDALDAWFAKHPLPPGVEE